MMNGLLEPSERLRSSQFQGWCVSSYEACDYNPFKRTLSKNSCELYNIFPSQILNDGVKQSVVVALNFLVATKQ